jgi:hypothetical protein
MMVYTPGKTPKGPKTSEGVIRCHLRSEEVSRGNFGAFELPIRRTKSPKASFPQPCPAKAYAVENK